MTVSLSSRNSKLRFVGGWSASQNWCHLIWEFLTVKGWLEASKIGTLYIEPGSPWQNGYAGSFNSRLRDELLAVEIFETLRQAKALAVHWRLEYNHRRPHSSLGYQTPAAFAATCVPRPPLRLAALASATAAERTWRGDSATTLS